MQIQALGYLGFSSPRYLEWKQFGPEVLGLAVTDDGEDGSVRLRMDERHHRITIHAGDLDNVEYIGWELQNRIAFEAALMHLEAKGYPPTLASKAELENRRVCNMAWVVDPAGFRHEVYYGQQHDVNPFVPGRPISGFVAGDLGIGHCVLIVPENTRALQDFATDVMGFTTHWPLGSVEIYRCNFRSHCLIYLPIPGLRGMEHFYLDLKHLDDVGRALDICRSRNILQRDLGRYVQDDDLSFYLRSPAGVDIQYALGVREDTSYTNRSIMGPAGKPGSCIWGHDVVIPGLGSMVRPVKKSD
jgi:extradiol dioxygenase